VKRRLSVALIVAAASLPFAVVNMPAARAADTPCDELHGAGLNNSIPGGLEVPPYGVCHVNGWAIGGNVKVDQGAKLFTRNGTSIGGSITATSPQQLNIEDSTSIDGSVYVTGPGGGFGGFACGSTIGGGVTLQNLTSGSWIIGQPTSPPPDGYVYNGGGSSDPDLTCESPNAIEGAVTFNNNKVARLKLAANSIDNAVSITNNSVFNESINVEDNTIFRSLACSGNTFQKNAPPAQFGNPVLSNQGLPNTVGGTESGQCAGL